jgi:hypothetical protein
MKYMLLIYADQSEMPQYTPEQSKAAIQNWMSYQNELKAAGVIVEHNSLNPVTDATNVRVRGGKRLIADGPFAETHEQLGGYFVLECANLDEAIDWAGKMPGAKYGTVEIRPIMTYSQDWQE